MAKEKTKKGNKKAEKAINEFNIYKQQDMKSQNELLNFEIDLESKLLTLSEVRMKYIKDTTKNIEVWRNSKNSTNLVNLKTKYDKLEFEAVNFVDVTQERCISNLLERQEISREEFDDLFVDFLLFQPTEISEFQAQCIRRYLLGVSNSIYSFPIENFANFEFLLVQNHNVKRLLDILCGKFIKKVLIMKNLKKEWHSNLSIFKSADVLIYNLLDLKILDFEKIIAHQNIMVLLIESVGLTDTFEVVKDQSSCKLILPNQNALTLTTDRKSTDIKPLDDLTFGIGLLALISSSLKFKRLSEIHISYLLEIEFGDTHFSKICEYLQINQTKSNSKILVVEYTPDFLCVGKSVLMCKVSSGDSELFIHISGLLEISFKAVEAMGLQVEDLGIDSDAIGSKLIEYIK
eukprot:NODE_396_length_8125_cov_0.508472.p3 type:complete len:404 gc:universal NODE_396_length_8125_cov_0.508472:6073-7284(+)